MKTTLRQNTVRSTAAILIVLWASVGAAETELPAAVRDAIGQQTRYTAEERQGVARAAERAVRAGVPADDVAVVISRSGARSADSAMTERLLGTATAVQEQGLPAQPVLNRVQQGLAKGVPVDQVAAAAERLAGRLRDAKPLVNSTIESGVAAGSARDREYALETVARALERDIPKAAISGTGAKVRDQKGSVVLFDKAVGTMTGLVEGGMKPDAAARIVQDAVKRGSSEKDLSKLERDVSEGLKKDSKTRDSGKKDRKDDRRDDRGKSGRDDSRDSGSGSGHGSRGSGSGSGSGR